MRSNIPSNCTKDFFALRVGSSAHRAVNAPLNRGGGGHDGRIMQAGCEGLVVRVSCGSGCEGYVGWLFVLQAPTIPVEL